MPENTTPENILNSIMETFADSVPRQKSATFFEVETSVSAQMNRLFGRQKSIHKVLGGGKSADVLLWRNKKISSGMLVGATAIWVLFEWLNYNFLTLGFLVLSVGMLIQFVWANASGLVNRSQSKVPRLLIPDELFVNVAVTVGAEVNRFLSYLQDVSTGRNVKLFLMIIASLWAAAIIGTWCNFLTVAYIGFVAAHTLPVFYEKYDDQVDNFIYNLLGQLQNQYRKLDSGVLRRIPKGNIKSKKSN
ncbi:reticulon-like protein B8 [Aristolochia californica]|uniref:reticulon-like protein B8 n=1 Tax=Aristolochia californica TaxID=171875 RepID=UPI0035DA17ED